MMDTLTRFEVPNGDDEIDLWIVSKLNSTTSPHLENGQE